MDKIIRDIWILFKTKEEEKKVREKKEINDRLAKDRIIRNIRTLFENK